MNAPPCPWQVAAGSWPQLPGLVTPTRTWTFAEWNDEVARRAAELVSSGWHRGDRIGLRDGGTAEFTFWLAAAMRVGLVACVTSPRWSPRQLAQAASCSSWRGWMDMGVATACCPAPVYSISKQADPQALDRMPGLSTILFSSGSSGDPKAIAHRLDAHLASADGANRNLPLGPGDRWPVSLPMSHVSGLGILFRCLLSGATVLLPEHRGPLESQLEEWQPTHLSLVPTQLKRLLDRNLGPPSRLRGVLVGGAALPAGLRLRAAAMHWPLVTTYGLTEMGSQVTATSPGAEEAELATCGRILSGRELKVSDQGEILVRGRARFEGFVRDATLVSTFDNDGWYATGDSGFLDRDGLLRVTGRRDLMFISGGENCFPEEIENGLLELPGIHHACVVAIPHPEFGQRPFAFVDAETWSPALWRAGLAELLPRFKIPDHFAPWPSDMPLKPNRARLSEWAVERLAEA